MDQIRNINHKIIYNLYTVLNHNTKTAVPLHKNSQMTINELLMRLKKREQNLKQGISQVKPHKVRFNTTLDKDQFQIIELQ